MLDGFDHDPPRASPPAEITVHGDHDFYDFEAKYLAGSSTRIDLPADVDEEVADEIGRLSVSAFEALECEGLARVDFFLLADGSLVINEINTMPGFTPSSMFPRMWMETGMTYADLHAAIAFDITADVESWVRLAAEVHDGMERQRGAEVAHPVIRGFDAFSRGDWSSAI